MTDQERCCVELSRKEIGRALAEAAAAKAGWEGDINVEITMCVETKGFWPWSGFHVRQALVELTRPQSVRGDQQ